jgi:hypothetical protein
MMKYLGRCGEWIEAGQTGSLGDINYKTDEVEIALCFEAFRRRYWL